MKPKSSRDYRAISLIQPWAWLILHGGKDIENRSWRDDEIAWPRRILIHASKTRIERDHYAVARSVEEEFGIKVPDMEQLDYGGFVGSVTVTGVQHNDARDAVKSRWAAPGQFGYLLAAPREIPFVEFKGAPRFFRVPWYEVQNIEEKLKKAG